MDQLFQTNKYQYIFKIPLDQRPAPIMDARIVTLQFNRNKDSQGEYISLVMWDTAGYGHFCPGGKVREIINRYSLDGVLNEWFQDSPNLLQ